MGVFKQGKNGNVIRKACDINGDKRCGMVVKVARVSRHASLLAFSVLLLLVLFSTQDAIGQVETIAVEMGDFFFNPETVEVVAGQEVVLQVRNNGKYPHTLTIEGSDVDLVLSPGEEGEARLLITQPGEYRLYCRYHAQMEGTLKVLAGDAGEDEGGVASPSTQRQDGAKETGDRGYSIGPGYGVALLVLVALVVVVVGLGVLRGRR